MISYNPREWFSYIFRFHKADTFRKLLPAMGAIALYSGAVAFAELEFWKPQDTTHVKNIGLMHNLLAVVISVLLVFRTNTAYERWWEGRKLWGELLNVSRNLAMKLRATGHKKADFEFFKRVLPIYAIALRNHLQDAETSPELFADLELAVDLKKHLPNQLAAAMTAEIISRYRRKQITGEELLLFREEMHAFTNICGACERIKNSPIPYSYSAFIKKFVFFYSITMPIGHAFTLGYYVIPVVVFVFYVLASLELIAEEIEDPFGRDPNDLPLGRIIAGIDKSVEEILG